jgi:hypothetical protein
MIIADLVNGDADALKTGAGPFSGLARNLGSSAGVFAGFVGSVAAVVFAVADERLVNALGVVALEVVGLAVDGAAARRLVRLVLAVDGAVALPTDRDADAGSLTSVIEK